MLQFDEIVVQLHQMLKARIDEHNTIAAEIATREARQDRIKAEVEELFVKAGQSEALDNGTEIDGYKVKKVKGNTTTFDKMGLMQAVGLTPEELDAFYETKPKKAYIKISKAGKKDDE